MLQYWNICNLFSKIIKLFECNVYNMNMKYVYDRISHKFSGKSFWKDKEESNIAWDGLE